MAGVQIPGEPEGTPYDDGFDRTAATTPQNPDTAYAAGNWASGTLASTQEVGHPDNNLICDQSGFKVPVAEGLVESFYGLKTRRADYDPRHPQDFVRAGSEREQKGSDRPEQDDVFLATNAVQADDL